MDLDITPLGDRAVSMQFGEGINEDVHKRIRNFVAALDKASLKGITEWVPAYTSVAVYYDPAKITYSLLCEKLRFIGMAESSVRAPVIYKIPVLYNGPDLPYVAKLHQLTEEAVIRIHTGGDYLIHMIGFMPGFPYLGGLPEQLATPRLANPRAKVEAGAVGIGGSQTGIYPDESPSGWRIIGHTPLKLFDLEREEPFLLSPGNYIRFFTIDSEEFNQIKSVVASGSYDIQTDLKEN